MTFGELKSQLLILADDPSITVGNAGIWINVNYKLLLREHEWPFMQSTSAVTVTSGTAEYTLASDFSPTVSDFARPIKAYKGSTANQQTEIPFVYYEDRNILGQRPSVYMTPDRTKFGVLPTPTNSSDIYTLEYEKTVADLTADVDEPVTGFLADFHWILIFKALVMYQYQQREASSIFLAQYNEILQKMLQFYDLPSSSSIAQLSRGTGVTYRDSSSPLVP
jgi:hypothetical protein